MDTFIVLTLLTLSLIYIGYLNLNSNMIIENPITFIEIEYYKNH